MAMISPAVILPLTLTTQIAAQLATLSTLAGQPCEILEQQIHELVTNFYTSPITPQSFKHFEEALNDCLKECGRAVVETVVNHIEPEDPRDAPKQIEREGLDYSRKNYKTPNRGGIATSFGTIQLRRCLYEPLQEASDEQQGAFAALEVNLGIVAGNATPLLADRVGVLASQHTQQEVLDILKRDYHVIWSVGTLRKVTEAVSEGIASHLQAARVKCLLGWLAQAEESCGRHRPTLSVGRDGCMLPMRKAATYKEGAVATVSVLDRRGRRLGTVYLGEMPEPYQETLSATLTELLPAVLRGRKGPCPRLVYVTDAGYHPTQYYKEVLQEMKDPQNEKQVLEWRRVVDFYHAAGYLSKLAEILFSEERGRQAWAHRMRHLLLDEEHGLFRVLHSATYHHSQQSLTAKSEELYEDAYNYLLNHGEWMAYRQYTREGLPIGSGVTEAGCKIIFTQRFKESGMKWDLEGGEVILRLREAVLSGVWDKVYEAYLQSRPLVKLKTRYMPSEEASENAA
jgi:hypothetical protein